MTLRRICAPPLRRSRARVTLRTPADWRYQNVVPTDRGGRNTMLDHTVFGRGVLLLAAAAACGTGTAAEPGGNAAGSTTADAGASIPDGDATPPPGGSRVTDLPCDVARVIVRSCATCHGVPLRYGAPMRLLTHEDLTAPSRTDASRTVVRLSIDRMRDARAPMPPTGLAPASDIAVLEAWAAEGTPRGTCSAAPSGGSTPYDTPSVCTSNTWWTGGDRGSPLMHPGLACIACHGGGSSGDDRAERPIFSAAGTLYPTAHEPNDCNGTAGSDVRVVITDARGATYTLAVNAAGNFFTDAPLLPPYRASVVSANATRSMATPQANGDCNACHEERGSQNAPGRVMAP